MTASYIVNLKSMLSEMTILIVLLIADFDF